MGNSESKKKKIALVLVHEGQSFQLAMAANARAAAKESGVDIDVFFSEGNSGVQMDILNRLIHRSNFDDTDALPDAILFEPVAAHEMTRLFQRLKRLNIPVGILNMTINSVDGIRAEFPKYPIFQVGNDQREVGRIQFRQLRQVLPQGGTILYVVGRSDTEAARERKAGFLEASTACKASYPLVTHELLAGDWTPDAGEKKASFFKRGHANALIHAIVSQNDGMAEGVIRSGAYPNTPVIGCDGMAEGKALVDSRKMTATVITPPTAGAALASLVDFWERGVMPKPAQLLAPIPYPR